MGNKQSEKRVYSSKLDTEDLLCAVSLHHSDDTDTVRTDYYYHSDDTCVWAKDTEDGIYCSDDDIFHTEREDATHIVAFLK